MSTKSQQSHIQVNKANKNKKRKIEEDMCKEKEKEIKRISYSQISLFKKCPLAWKIKYVDNIKFSKASKYTMFGRAIHELIQERIKNYYTDRKKDVDYKALLLDKIIDEYNKEKEENNNNIDFLSEEEIVEFNNIGLLIFEEFNKRITKLFPYKGYELVGIELPLEYNFNNDLGFIGYIDIIIKNKRENIYRIIDLKTSYKGWDKEKEDHLKRFQLTLYKEFYSKLFNVDLKQIDVEFLIFKRTIFQPKNVAFKISRIQQFKPASGIVSINKYKKEFFNPFIDLCYPEYKIMDQEYYDGNLKATPSKDNCKWCDFKNTSYCTKGV